MKRTANSIFCALAMLAVSSVFADNGQEIVKVKTSGEQWSGSGKDWSQYYYLETDPPPAGYYLYKAAFQLAGDRSCGAWSTCDQALLSPYKAAWEFRMQGHDENLEIREFSIKVNFDENGKPDLKLESLLPNIKVTVSGRRATSTGIITAVYRPEPPPQELPQAVQGTTRREEWSGEGRDYSDWYSLTSLAAPYRYALSKVDFHLEGDRSCGAWAECGLGRQDSSSATWNFRLQGHDESFPPNNRRRSTGVLTATYSLVKPLVYHAVVKGDSLWKLAHQYYGSREWPRIFQANHGLIKDPDLIYPGQRFYIPD